MKVSGRLRAEKQGEHGKLETKAEGCREEERLKSEGR